MGGQKRSQNRFTAPKIEEAAVTSRFFRILSKMLLPVGLVSHPSFSGCVVS